MIVQDFLPMLPVRCMLILLKTIGNFCRQKIAVNVALTAVGLLWNVADHVSQNHIILQEKLDVRLLEDSVSSADVVDVGMRRDVDSDGLPRRLKIGDIWWLIYEQLSALCVDERTDVSRSASQTLYPMLKTHAILLPREELALVLNELIIPTFSSVVNGSPRNPNSGNIAVESPAATSTDDSRNSACSADTYEATESKCIAITGLAHALASLLEHILLCSEFLKMWKEILGLMKQLIICKNHEDNVTLAGATALKNLVRAVDRGHEHNLNANIINRAMEETFDTWTSVCQHLEQSSTHKTRTLVAVIACMNPTLGQLRGRLSDAQVVKATTCLYSILNLRPSDALYFTRSSDLQAEILQVLLLLAPSAQFPQPDAHHVPLVLGELIRYIGLVNQPPWLLRGRNCFVGLAKDSMKNFAEQFASYSEESMVIRSGVAHDFLKIITPIIDARYAGPNVQLWERATETAITVIDYSLRGLAASAQHTDLTMQSITGTLLCSQSQLAIQRNWLSKPLKAYNLIFNTYLQLKSMKILLE